MSAAIALIGEPKVILMDEPTTGMDIQTKNAFIHTLHKIVQQKKRSIVITSHRYVCILYWFVLIDYYIFSMSECENLCNRIGIMIKGEFRCLGSTQELKEK